LVKESVGGHSNTSAYSLVYIDTSKPEILMDAEWASSIGGVSREEKMDQGELEALAVTLPQDLAQYVVNDNNTFQGEITTWDTEQNLLQVQQQAQDMDQMQTLPFAKADVTDLQVLE
jgi:Cu/Ag efflux pump CusA